MTVRAKFKCNSKEERLHWNGSPSQKLVTVKMTPVMSGSEENKKFYESSPSGSLELGILAAGVGDLFELGKEYYLDFTPAE